jgi:virginiamycin B lyase
MLRACSVGLGITLAMFFCALQRVAPGAQDTGPAALMGQVTSPEEGGPMEGVIVSAKGVGSNITVSVISDVKGRYSFPASRVKPGKYLVSVRAGGYEIRSPKAVAPAASRTGRPDPDRRTPPLVVSVDVGANKATQLDLRLGKAADVASQLTTAEWMVDFPGTEEEKENLEGCAACHSLERVAKSKYNAAAFADVIKRMDTYADGSGPLRAVKKTTEFERPGREDSEGAMSTQDLAQYLSQLNLSSVSRWAYPLWTVARPRGEATRAIYTEYDLPRPESQPYDAVADAEGIIWYTDSGSLYLGRLDPRSGTVKEWRVPEVKPGVPATGTVSLSFDKEGNVWLGSLYQGAIYRFDKKTEKFVFWSAPKEYNNSQVRTSMTAPEHSDVDGKVWFAQSGPNAVIHRLDVATGNVETFSPFGAKKEGHSIGCIVSTPENDLLFCDHDGGGIGELDAKTGRAKMFRTPSPASGPRGGSLDAQGRLFFGEESENRVGMFDPKTEKFLEWRMVMAWTLPRDAMPDKTGQVWAAGVTADRVIRMVPDSKIQFTTATGRRVEYILPRRTQIQRVFVDNSTNPVTFWAGSNLGASIVRLQPLE